MRAVQLGCITLELKKIIYLRQKALILGHSPNAPSDQGLRQANHVGGRSPICQHCFSGSALAGGWSQEPKLGIELGPLLWGGGHVNCWAKELSLRIHPDGLLA